MNGITAAILLLGAACIAPIAAQPTIPIPSVKVGDRLRVESPALFGIRAIGPLIAANQGFVSVAVSDDRRASIVVPWAAITSIDVARGHQRRSMAARGALVGIAAAVVAAPALFDRGEASATLGANLGTLATFGLPVLGAAVGWLAGPPNWQLIDWRPAIDTVLPEGEAVRLHLPEDASVLVRARRRTFRATALTTGDSLFVRTSAGRRIMPWSDVSELHLRTRRDRMRGAALGFTSMALVAALWLQVSPPPRDELRADFLTVRMLAGGLAGAIIGAPGWQRVPTPIR